MLSLDDVDWSRTRAYCKSGLGQIIINMKGREPEGIVNPGQEYENLKRELIRKLKDFMNELTGGKEGVEVYAREDIYCGDYFDGSTIMDITPTVLYLMGCKIPEDMDGKVLKGIFKEAFLEKHPIEFMEPEQDVSRRAEEGA
ncbi:MAG: hypothetical protein JRC57_05285 [Deltaproteobacteria bacterium]|nr:hypothetical protein [Deltaproteobacteria bacterium]